MTLVVQRAITLLRLFSAERPEIGLSEAARLSQESKATVYRLLTTLCDSGLIELVESRKTYRLGPAVHQLARVREVTVPLLSVVQPALDALLEETGETCHFSRFNGSQMTVIATAESRKVNRISMQGVEAFPICTTAAGQVFLAHAAQDIITANLEREGIDGRARDDVVRKLATIRAAGFATVDRFENEEIFGIARPVLSSQRGFLGSLAVIVPPNRVTETVLDQFLSALEVGCAHIAKGLGQ